MYTSIHPRIYWRLGLTPEAIASLCQQWRIIELAVFGSIARDDFNPDSDIDILYRFHPDSKPTFDDLDRIQTQLQNLTGRSVDLVSKTAIENSHNPIRRRNILESAITLYVYVA